MEVLVFVTNISNRRLVNKVQPLLTAVKAIAQWNFDLQDCDHILRIEADNLSPRQVEAMLQTAGFDCYELDY
jgi:hypothetical protein